MEKLCSLGFEHGLYKFIAFILTPSRLLRPMVYHNWLREEPSSFMVFPFKLLQEFGVKTVFFTDSGPKRPKSYF